MQSSPLLPPTRSCPLPHPDLRPPTRDKARRAGGLGTGPQGFSQGGASGGLSRARGGGCSRPGAPPRSRGGSGGGESSGISSSTYSRVTAGVEGRSYRLGPPGGSRQVSLRVSSAEAWPAHLFSWACGIFNLEARHPR